MSFRTQISGAAQHLAPERRMPFFRQARSEGAITMYYVLASRLPTVPERCGSGLMPGPSDFVPCRSGLGLDFLRIFCISTKRMLTSFQYSNDTVKQNCGLCVTLSYHLITESMKLHFLISKDLPSYALTMDVLFLKQHLM